MMFLGELQVLHVLPILHSFSFSQVLVAQLFLKLQRSDDLQMSLLLQVLVTVHSFSLHWFKVLHTFAPLHVSVTLQMSSLQVSL